MINRVWERMKNNRRGTWVIIFSVIIAFAIHLLFNIHPENEWWVAKWSAGEILTYIGTIFLGYWAVRQNDELKRSNDESQAKLEKLTKEANGLAVLSKIIEYELAKKEAMENAILLFEKSTNLQQIMSTLSEKDGTDTEGKKIFLVNLEMVMDYEKEAMFSFLNVCSSLGIDYTKKENGNIFFNNVFLLMESINRIISDIKVPVISENDLERLGQEFSDSNRIKEDFEKTKSIFLREKKDELDKLIYSTYDLPYEIKEIY